MPNLSVNDVQPGMVLASDVNDRNGRPLLKAGTELTEKHIKIFRTWGISSLAIEGDDTQDPLQDILAAHPEYMEQAEESAAELFLHNDMSHPLIEAMLPAWKTRYIKLKVSQA